MRALIINQSQKPCPRKYLEGALNRIGKELRKRKIGGEFYNRELVIVFLDKGPARALNQQFRGKDYATDVLSFSASTPVTLGELILCSQVLERQSKEHGLNYRDECTYMVLHGLLHLLGYDHESDEGEAERMYRLQDEVFEKLIHSVGTNRN